MKTYRANNTKMLICISRHTRTSVFSISHKNCFIVIYLKRCKYYNDIFYTRTYVWIFLAPIKMFCFNVFVCVCVCGATVRRFVPVDGINRARAICSIWPSRPRRHTYTSLFYTFIYDQFAAARRRS